MRPFLLLLSFATNWTHFPTSAVGYFIRRTYIVKQIQIRKGKYDRSYMSVTECDRINGLVSRHHRHYGSTSRTWVAATGNIRLRRVLQVAGTTSSMVSAYRRHLRSSTLVVSCINLVGYAGALVHCRGGNDAVTWLS